MDTRISDITDPSIITPAEGCNNLYLKLFNSMYDGLCLFEVHGTKVKALYLNESYFNNVGYTKEQYLPYLDNVTVTLFEEDELNLFEKVKTSLSEGTEFECDVRGYRYNGSVGCFSVRARQLDFIKSEYPVFIASITDITRRIDLKQQLLVTLERYRILEEISTTYQFEYKPVTDHMTFTPGQQRDDIFFESYSGYLRKRDQLHPYDAICFYSVLCKASRKEYRGFTDVRSLNKEKTDYEICRLYYSSIENEYRSVVSVVGRNEFITNNPTVTPHLLAESHEIFTEGLVSPYEGFRQIENKLAAHSGNSFMLIADIDDFSAFNEKYGTENGESAMKLTAAVIRKIFPDSVIFRYIGDDFAVFAENITESALYDRIDKLRAELTTIEINVDGKRVNSPITLSIGASWATAGSTRSGIKDYFITADKALLLAKQNGKNRLETEKIIF